MLNGVGGEWSAALPGHFIGADTTTGAPEYETEVGSQQSVSCACAMSALTFAMKQHTKGDLNPYQNKCNVCAGNRRPLLERLFVFAPSVQSYRVGSHKVHTAVASSGDLGSLCKSAAVLWRYVLPSRVMAVVWTGRSYTALSALSQLPVVWTGQSYTALSALSQLPVVWTGQSYTVLSPLSQFSINRIITTKGGLC
jgi:hypothetical protein